ncbi:MAG TPA: hypothetical protein VHA05_00860 [Candidatus Saccharimonadales bacterium]|nr:hypothetical protein [Candidatus Saccharimonadales bacterium]
MSRHPDTFPDVDLEAAGIVLTPDDQPEFLGGGFNSSAWRAGNQVLKITSHGSDQSDALKLLEAMKREHGTVEPYIGDYMADTAYALVNERSSGTSHVLVVQPFIEGSSLREFFSRPDANVDPFVTFLEKSMAAYKGTRLMPDISCIEKGFWPLWDSNTIIRPGDDEPVLVDTTAGKTQRSRTLGPAWNRFIYSGALLAHKWLEG